MRQAISVLPCVSAVCVEQHKLAEQRRKLQGSIWWHMYRCANKGGQQQNTSYRTAASWGAVCWGGKVALPSSTLNTAPEISSFFFPQPCSSLKRWLRQRNEVTFNTLITDFLPKQSIAYGLYLQNQFLSLDNAVILISVLLNDSLKCC